MSQSRVATPDRTLEREFKVEAVDVDGSQENGSGRVSSRISDDVDNDRAEMADDLEDEIDVDDEFDDERAEVASDDTSDDDRAEIINDVDEHDDEFEDELVDVGDDREAVPPSRLLNRERTSPSPSTSKKEPRRRPRHMSPQLTDAVRYLLNRYELAHAAGIPQNVAVVSALSGEGVTTVSQALAEVLAVDFSVSVCWVDFSWTSDRGGSSQSGDDSGPGLYDVLLKRAVLGDALVGTPGSAVTHLPAGDITEDDRHAMVRWPELSDVVTKLRGSFDHVVFDSAPLLANSDALALLRYVDSHLLVTKHGATTMRQVKAAAAELETIPSLGALLNKYNPSTPSFVRRLFSE